METQTTTPKKQKADLDLKIELPNSEKPFYNKMSTENNMISQVKKAGTKLGETENLNVSVNGTAISLSKAETQSATLSTDLQSKLNPEREINKSNLSNTNEQEPSFSLKQSVKITLEDLKITDQDPNILLGKTIDLPHLENKTFEVYNVRANPDNDHKYYLREENVPHTMDSETVMYKSELANLISNKLDTGTEKNIDYLKDQIKFLGFGEDASLHNELSQKVNSDAKEFTISIQSDKTSFQNKASFELQFNRSAETNNVFLNKFDARLINEKRNVDLLHTFAVKNNGFTAKQAINLLEGRSVKTEITNPNTKEKETAFVKLKLNEEKNEKGNFKLQVYNKNYGVDTAKIVEKSNLLFKDEKHKEITIKSLEKGNIVAVKMKDKDKEIEGKAVLSPQYKTLNLYDNNMKRLNSNAPVLEETAKVSENVKKQQHQSR
jgi:hypothetical protein